MCPSRLGVVRPGGALVTSTKKGKDAKNGRRETPCPRALATPSELPLGSYAAVVGTGGTIVTEPRRPWSPSGLQSPTSRSSHALPPKRRLTLDSSAHKKGGKTAPTVLPQGQGDATSMTQPYASAPGPVAEPKGKRHNTNRGLRFPPDPIRTEEFAILLEHCKPLRPGRESELSALRLRTLLVLLYRTGLRISEALDLYEFDLRRNERAIVVRHGKGDKRRIVMVDEWGWRELDLADRPLGDPAGSAPAGHSWALGRSTAGRTRRAAANGPAARESWITPPSASTRLSARVRSGLQSRRHPSVQLARPTRSCPPRCHRALPPGIDPMERLAPIAARRPPTTVIPSVATREGLPTASTP